MEARLDDERRPMSCALPDRRDYDEMNRGRVGDNPPVRTTVGCYGGTPGGSLVEIDCIAVV